MLRAFLIVFMVYCFSCVILYACIDDASPNKEPKKSYDEQVIEKVNTMKQPVTLVGKYKSLGFTGITVKGADGEVYTIGNLSSFANSIGESRVIGDTIR